VRWSKVTATWIGVKVRGGANKVQLRCEVTKECGLGLNPNRMPFIPSDLGHRTRLGLSASRMGWLGHMGHHSLVGQAMGQAAGAYWAKTA
jgi:hypothetical protein